jgi:hypothetical protein
MTIDEAKQILLDDIQADGGLYNLGHYLSWTPGDKTITLDDQFELDELEAIVVWVQANQITKD